MARLGLGAFKGVLIAWAFAASAAFAQRVPHALPPDYPIGTVDAPFTLIAEPDSIGLGETRVVKLKEALVRFRLEAEPLARLTAPASLSLRGVDLVVGSDERLEPVMPIGWAARRIAPQAATFCTVGKGAATGLLRSTLKGQAKKARLCLVDEDRDLRFDAAFIDGMVAVDRRAPLPVEAIGYTRIADPRFSEGETVELTFDGLPIQKNRFRVDLRYSVGRRRQQYTNLFLQREWGYCNYGALYFFVKYDPAAPSVVRFFGTEVEILSLDRPNRILTMRPISVVPSLRVFPVGMSDNLVPPFQDFNDRACD